jgi:hypothetical protein
MNRIQGAVQIDLKKQGAVLEDIWDGQISESRRKEKGIPLALSNTPRPPRCKKLTDDKGQLGA